MSHCVWEALSSWIKQLLMHENTPNFADVGSTETSEISRKWSVTWSRIILSFPKQELQMLHHIFLHQRAAFSPKMWRRKLEGKSWVCSLWAGQRLHRRGWSTAVCSRARWQQVRRRSSPYWCRTARTWTWDPQPSTSIQAPPTPRRTNQEPEDTCFWTTCRTHPGSKREAG